MSTFAQTTTAPEYRACEDLFPVMVMDEVKEKTCTKCGEVKPFSEFGKMPDRKYGLHSHCRACLRISCAKWQKENPEKVRAQTKKRFYANREKCLRINREYHHTHRAEINARKKEYRKNVEVRIKDNCRRRVNRAMRMWLHRKQAKTETLIGTNWEHFIKHIESGWLPEMNWENYGRVWEIDHYVPVSVFNLAERRHQLAAFNWRNCRPLVSIANKSKRAALPEDWKLHANWLLSCTSCAT